MKDMESVANALNTVEALDHTEHDESTQTASGYKRRQAFHEALQQKQIGGRQAWEKNQVTKMYTMALAQEAVHSQFLLYSDSLLSGRQDPPQFE